MRRVLPFAYVALTLWIDALLWWAGDSGPVGWVLSFIVPQLFILPTAIAAIVSVRRREWGLVALNASVSIGQIFGPMGLCFGHPKEGTPDLNVLSYNIACFGITRPKPMGDVIKLMDPDIFCLQEASEWKFKPPVRFESRLTNYHIFDKGAMVIGSKRPFLSTDVTIFPSHLIYFHWNVQEVSIDVNGKVVRVVNVHMVPDGYQPPEWPKVSLLEQVERKRRLRDEEVDEILRRVRSKPGPVIVCGDFNQHAYGPRYRRIASELTDTYRATQTGFGYSLTPSIPTKRVDYIWTRGITPLRTRVLSKAKSDHLPVWAELKL